MRKLSGTVGGVANAKFVPLRERAPAAASAPPNLERVLLPA